MVKDTRLAVALIGSPRCVGSEVGRLTSFVALLVSFVQQEVAGGLWQERQGEELEQGNKPTET